MASTTYTGAQPTAGSRIVGGHKGEGPGPEIMAADSLEGDSVVNADGEDLGRLKDIMIDVNTGRIAYAVLSTGGLLGIGDKLFAIPWGALVMDADRKCFILDIAKDRLEKAAGFDKDHWPTTADLSWAAQGSGYQPPPEV